MGNYFQFFICLIKDKKLTSYSHTKNKKNINNSKKINFNKIIRSEEVNMYTTNS
jgi:hypothetical protein